jgi:hypothetical protein
LRQLLACAFGAAFACAVCAAPVDAVDIAPAAGSDAGGGQTRIQRQPAHGPAADTSGASKTVDLLIELQPRTAGLTFDARARPAERAIRPTEGERAGSTQPARLEPKGGLFGVGATPLPVARSLTDGPAPSGGDGRGPGGPAGRALADRATPGGSADLYVSDPWWRLPMAAVGFLREYRQAALWLSLGLLGVLGLATKRRARRGR